MAAVKPLIEGIGGCSIKLSSKIGAGDTFSTITGTTDFEGAPNEIAHNDGEVLLITYWISWNGNCHKPMTNNQKFVKENGEGWGEKVKIICISLDEKLAGVKKHIKAKNMTLPIHYHVAKSDCKEVYEVQNENVPHVMIIDQKGMIAYKGDPANRIDLKTDIDNLLKDKPLIGEGCAPE